MTLEEGLELIELISLDCKNKEGEWFSSTEIKIDKLGYVITNGAKAKDFWNGKITTTEKPLRIKVRNIRYCVTRMLKIFPNFDLKNLFEDAVGNFFLNIVKHTKNTPCIPPQIKKFHDAPCQIPITIIEINKLMKTRLLDFLFLKTNG